tara:strand:- start:220 stop:666 length:447 start_codon:yes stop_codon:yes gene_type:complete
MKNYLLLNLLLSFSIIASLELEANAKFSECQGKVANYYLSNLVDGGSVEGWLKAAAMHEKYYNDRNFKVEVLTEMQYSVDEDGNVSDKFVSLDTLVVWNSLSARNEFQKYLENRSSEQVEKDEKEFSAFVNLYEKNTKVTERKRLCML